MAKHKTSLDYTTNLIIILWLQLSWNKIYIYIHSFPDEISHVISLF